MMMTMINLDPTWICGNNLISTRAAGVLQSQQQFAQGRLMLLVKS